MSVDLSDYVEPLRRMVANPDDDLYTSLQPAFLTNTLNDAFWMARLDQIAPLKAYDCDDTGSITPVDSNGAEISRDLIQLIVIYGATQIVTNELKNMLTVFSTSAGPAKYEIQRSANLLKEILVELRDRRNLILLQLGTVYASKSYVLDSVIERTLTLNFGDIYERSGVFLRGTAGYGWR